MRRERDENIHSSKDAPSIAAINLDAFLNGTSEECRKIASTVDDICRRVGFLIVENHGVPNDVVDDAWSGARAFFDLPINEKLKSQSTVPGCPRGYFPMESEALAKSLGVDTPPDIKESFGIGPLHPPSYEIDETSYEFHYGDNLWPELPTDFRTALTRYSESMQILGHQVLSLFAAALELPLDFFECHHSHPMCALRCLNYPASEHALLPMQKGAGEHSDYGSITLLKSDPNVSGLEIKLPSGEWARAPLVQDGFIVNIGDMMARWTNDRWVSTLHRVVQPEADGLSVSRRQSFAFFHNASFDAEIECIPTCLSRGEQPRYESVLAGEYLRSRFTAAIN